MELVTPAIGLIFWTAVVFILLVILLKKFARKPILTAVENRNESIENALKAAEKAKEDIDIDEDLSNLQEIVIYELPKPLLPEKNTRRIEQSYLNDIYWRSGIHYNFSFSEKDDNNEIP